MKYPFFTILLILFIAGCYEELPEVQPVILHESESPLFEIDSMSVLTESPELKIRVYFSTRYAALTPQQKEQIKIAQVRRNDTEIHELGHRDLLNDTLFVFDDVILEPGITCYEFFFVAISGGSFVGKSRSTEICLDLRPGVVVSSMGSSVSSLRFNYLENTKTFQVKNIGFTSSSWSLTSEADFLSADISDGFLSEGESIEISLELDRTSLLTRNYLVELSIEDDKGKAFIIPVQISNFKEEKWLISGRIIDAEYDKFNDKIIAISDFPNEIRKFDPVTNSIESLSLNKTPKCISISQDGQFAAIGHSTGFYYVNLSSMTLIDNYTGIGNTFDIVLGPNNWGYIFAKMSWGLSRVQCVNLENGEVFESLGGGIDGKTKAKLHPSGDYIYAIDPYSLTTIKKFDITGGVAQYLYEVTDNFSIGANDFWFSDDGNKIFLNNKRVLNLSSIQGEEGSLFGELESELGTQLETLDCSDDKIFTITSAYEEPANRVRTYQKNDLSFVGEVNLPDFFSQANNVLGGKLSDSEGCSGFFNSDGTKYYVLATWKIGLYESSNEWAIITVDVE